MRNLLLPQARALVVYVKVYLLERHFLSLQADVLTGCVWPSETQVVPLYTAECLPCLPKVLLLLLASAAAALEYRATYALLLPCQSPVLVQYRVRCKTFDSLNWQARV